MRQQRRIVILAGGDSLATDVTGAADVFSVVGYTQWQQKPTVCAPYLVEVAGLDDAVVSTTSGLRMLATNIRRDLSGPIDTLFVAGGIGVMRANQDPKLLKWLRERARHVRRCGRFALARSCWARLDCWTGSARTHTGASRNC